ncbi:MAG: hypothetical protein VW644_09585 [Alphaproteobacteria bacterium]|jgi:hypothetical protein
MSALGRLWRGELPFADAFWSWAVLGGILVNAVTSGMFYFLLVVEQTVPALIVGYGLSIPYNFVVTVGVWRSAEHHPRRTWAEAARIITLSAMVFLSVT